MLIRRMKVEDAAQAARIAARSMPQPWSEAAFLQEIRNPQALVLCADCGENNALSAVNHAASAGAAGVTACGLICGFAALQLTPDDAELTAIAVDAAHRRRGIAAALLAEARSQLAGKGIFRIVLEVRTGNAPAIAFYEKYGFTCIGVRRGFYTDPKEDALVMTDMKE